ncbi:MAG: single-stranded-DNA-specific exonuclease RecJ [Negativicutes bacterium]|nr:single-stranded-DNA-specific exonuclease RecJ [Negativicutes bacterium]
MKKNNFWRVKSFPMAEDELIAKKLGISAAYAALLRSRGYRDAAAMQIFLHPEDEQMPDPFAFRQMRQLVERLLQAREKQEQITIYGDYDADGVSATAVMLRGLQALGFTRLDSYIPSRFDEGYGLNAEVIPELAARGSRVLLTVDCGISAVAEAELLRRFGIDLLLTDHHKPGDILPAAYAIINPHLKEETYPFQQLAGVGVAFEVMRALSLTLHRPDILAALLPYVAIGTIGDVVALRGVNRALVYRGINQINLGKSPGLSALAQIAGIGRITCASQIAFQLVPRLNASGRMGRADSALSALLCGREEAAAWAAKLERLNQDRKQVELAVQTEAYAQYEALSTAEKQADAFLFYQADWHSGVLGIAAARMTDELHRPVFICCQDGSNLKGSGRAPRGYDLYQMLERISSLLLRFGGHAQAAGITFAAERLPEVRSAFREAAGCYHQLDHDEHILAADIELNPEVDLVEQQSLWRSLEPCGCENEEPLVLLRGTEVLQTKMISQGLHVNVMLQYGARRYNCFAWRVGERIAEFTGVLDVLARLQISNFHGSESFRLELIDWRPSRLDALPLLQTLRQLPPEVNFWYAEPNSREILAESGLVTVLPPNPAVTASFPYLPLPQQIAAPAATAIYLLDPLYEPQLPQSSHRLFDDFQLQQWRQLLYWLLPDRNHLSECYRWLRGGGSIFDDDDLINRHPGNLKGFYARICAQNALYIFLQADLAAISDKNYNFPKQNGNKTDLEKLPAFQKIQEVRLRLLQLYFG